MEEGEGNRVRNVTLRVAEMRCEGCAKRVRRALSALEFVRRADVSLVERRVWVLLDGGSVDLLLGALEAAGYRAVVED